MSETTIEAGADAHLLASTIWAELPEAVLTEMLRGAVVRGVRARGTIFGLSDRDARAGILLAGTARAFLAAADGRQLTVRYARRGALVGRRSDMLGGHTPVAIHALTDVEILDLDAAHFIGLLDREPTLASAVVAELGRRLEDVYATVADAAFGTIRERVARHLLAVTEDSEADARRVTSITQQELADGIGTLREVVARALADLRKAGLVATGAGQIEILDVAGLRQCLSRWQLAVLGSSNAAPKGSRPAVSSRQPASVQA